MRFFFILCVLVCTSGFSQRDLLASEYFKKGEYQKALHEYKKLHAKSSTNVNYIFQIINAHQQLEQYNEVESFLLKLMGRINYPAFLVELGYNYQIKEDLENAKINYDKAIASIDIRPSNVFAVARSFQSHTLLEEAVISYEKAMVLNPSFDFSIQLARLYGEQGNIRKMLGSYINFAESNPVSIDRVKRAIGDFVSENSDNENNILFRKLLLKRMQEKPNLIWNSLLSWLFIQQKDFKKAFIQEKAIFNRKPESLNKIRELALISASENEHDIAKEIFTYIINTAQDLDTLIDAHFNLLQIEINTSSKEHYEIIKAKYLEVFARYGKLPQTLKIQIAYAHFLAFYMNDTKSATQVLEESLKLRVTNLKKAEVKLELGDILVLQEQFNKALIYYTQIQRNLKNSTISQEARYRVAKTSYYKGDFKWAESQLKILKASTSQLIANDALDLKLLISDNKYEDSLQTALKLYAKSDLLAFQNRNKEAITLLSKILEEHKTEPIMAQALYRQAQLFVMEGRINEAEANYQAIIANYRDGILIDDACFYLAKIYEKYLNLPDKAKELYEKIVFNHVDSIYFVYSRKRYRALRGEVLN